MKYVLILLLILLFVGIILYYENSLKSYRRQIIAVNKNNDSLRVRAAKCKPSNSKLSLRFYIPSNTLALTKENISIYISPLEDSQIVNKLFLKTEVSILDEVHVGYDTWFYISIPSNNNINCRGWVKSKDFSLFYNNNREIIKR